MDNDVFDKLKGLQEILYKKFQIEKEIEDIPRALSIKEEMVSRLKKSYIEKSSHLKRKQDKFASLSTNLQETESSRLTFEEQMESTSTQREFEILDKQIKDAKEKEIRIRKDLRKEELEINELLENLKRSEELIASNESEYEKEKERIEDQINEKKNELKALAKQEAAITPGLSEDILFKFDRIIRNKEGKGVVPISDRICRGCHMHLPAQFVNEVRAGKEIKFCPYCSRILYYSESQETSEDFVYNDIDAGGLAEFVNQDDFDDDEV